MSTTTRQVQQHPKDMVSLQKLDKHSLNEKSLHALTTPLYAVKALHIKLEQGVSY